MLRRTTLLVVAVLLSALFGVEAAAQFTTLDPQQVSTSAGVNVSAVVVDRPNTDLDSVLRADLYAEIGLVDFSLYGRLPVFATLAGEPDEATVGNLEVGGAHRWSMDGPVSVVSHAGLVIPTASKSRKKRDVAFSGSTGYIGDLYVSSMPQLWGVRLATSPRLSLGAFFMQGDLGFDFLFPDVGSDEVGMRTSVGAGVDVAIATVTLEIANAGLLSESDSFEQTFSAGLDIDLGAIHPRVTYTTGLSDGLGDDYTLTVGATISF